MSHALRETAVSKGSPRYQLRCHDGATLAICVALLVFQIFLPGAGYAQVNATAATEGRRISEIIDAWRQRGVPFAYSTELIDDSMVVLAEPDAVDPEAIVNAVLAPYGLTLHAVEGLLVVGRMQSPAARPSINPESRNPRRAIPEVMVSASRYEILRELLEAPTFISQRTIQQLPLLGEDPLRAVQRLPGNASSGASAKSHLRGSAERDTGLILNGQRLLDPFHVRDYHNLFSAIDARAVSGVEVYTGGFPARYGDGMGGLVLIDTVTPESERHTEIGLSVYNTSLLTAGRIANGDIDWLVSARRGNLDLVLKPELGEPSYNDVFAEIGINFSPQTRLSINGLVASDNVIAITESDPEEREASTNDTRNAQFWVNWTQDWNAAITSYTTLSMASLTSQRNGSISDPEEIIAVLDDRRDIDVWGLQQDWHIDLNDLHRLSWGGEYRHYDANFRYRAVADYFGPFARFRGVPASINRNLDRPVDGDAIGIYLSDRWQLSDDAIVEFGLRWDKQTYTDTRADAQLSPRISVLYSLDKRTDLRLSLGRYYQSQGINDLQIIDGIARYFPAERADQIIAGVQHRSTDFLSWRIEAYYKDMTRLRTRFENQLDPLAVMPELKPDRVAILAPEARARGIEFSLAYESDKNMSWWLSYTLADVEDRINGNYVPRSWDQRHAAQFGMLWQNGRWDLSVVSNVHSGWPKTTLLIAPDSDPDDPELIFSERNRQNFRAFATLDLRLAYRSPLRIGELTAFFELSNATNRRNSCCVDFNLEDDIGPRPVLTQRDEYWFPLLPAIGVLWEF
ncbi:MAG: TonB-dependent receptor [Woeseia sp.]|nr:TonB-dependent receptor [Woeseia sp.]